MKEITKNGDTARSDLKLCFSHSLFVLLKRHKENIAKRNGGDVIIASKIKLNFRFHNPNTTKETANYILKMFFEANQGKLEKVLQKEIKIEKQIILLYNSQAAKKNEL